MGKLARCHCAIKKANLRFSSNPPPDNSASVTRWDLSDTFMSEIAWPLKRPLTSPQIRPDSTLRIYIMPLSSLS